MPKPLIRRLDFNCDLGEGCGDDAAIVPWITSASIACGGHTGNAASMDAAIGLCLAHGVAIGAHPSWPDKQGFGRREQAWTANEVQALMHKQLTAIAQRCQHAGAQLAHVKPHGALYNQAAADPALAQVLVAAIKQFDARLLVFALAGSHLQQAVQQAGLAVAAEAFAERAYLADGRLAPRHMPGAVLHTWAEALAQVRQLLHSRRISTLDGGTLALEAHTLCLHGDRADAADFARALHKALRDDGITLAPCGADT